MNPLTVNAAIALDHVLGSTAPSPSSRSDRSSTPVLGRVGRRSGRAVHAARTARVALERAGL